MENPSNTANTANTANEEKKTFDIKISRTNKKSIIDVEYEGEIYPITMNHLAPYWKNAGRIIIRNIGVHVQGPGVICWMTTEKGNAGVIFIWDVRTKKIIHVSEGSHIRKALVFGSIVFSLREVVKPDINELVLCMTPGPVMDGDSKKKVQAIPLKIKIFDKKFNLDNYKLGSKDGAVYAGFRNEIRNIKLKVEKTEVKANPDAQAQSAEASEAAENPLTKNPSIPS